MYFTLNLILATYLVSIIKTYLKYYFTTKQNIYYSCCGNCYSVCFTILKSTFNFFNSILGLSPSTHTQRFNYLKIISNWLIILFFFAFLKRLSMRVNPVDYSIASLFVPLSNHGNNYPCGVSGSDGARATPSYLQCIEVFISFLFNFSKMCVK